MSATIPLHKSLERSLRQMPPTGWAITLAWVLLVGSYCIAALTVHNGRGLTAFGDIVQCLAALFACGGLILNWRTTEKRTRVFWALLRSAASPGWWGRPSGPISRWTCAKAF